MVPCPTLTTSPTLIQSNCSPCMSNTIMTKEKIEELLRGVYSGWKNIDAVVDEIHESLNTVNLPPIINKTLDHTDDDESGIEKTGS